MSLLSVDSTSMFVKVEKIHYSKDSKILTIDLIDKTFVGYYKKNAKLSLIENDLVKFLKEQNSNVKEIEFIDINGHKISKKAKLKDLLSIQKKKQESESKKAKKKSKPSRMPIRTEEKEDILYESAEEEAYATSVAANEKKRMKEEVPKSMERALRDEIDLSEIPSRPSGPLASLDAKEPEITPEVYNINMALQYYSIMMEKRSYLLYVYFSHEEIQILDEEGKIIYRTSIKIETYKKEPPILNLNIEGEGFEVHPLNGKVVVKKDAINPPVMIFSVMPLKIEKSEKTKKIDVIRRFLNIYIDFEDKRISHTVLAIIVQKKHYKLKLGPITFNMGKGAAYATSIITLLIGIGSFLYTIFSFGSGSGLGDLLGSVIPGLASVIFFITYLVSIFQGFYPLKQKWLNLLNFDKYSPINK
jgi:hypothetical protein